MLGIVEIQLILWEMVHDSCVIRDRVWECQHYHHSLLYFPSTNINNMSFPCFASKSENHDMDSSVHLVCHEEPSVVVVLPFVWREVHLEFLSLLLPSLFLPSDQVSRKSCTHGIPESESLSTVCRGSCWERETQENWSLDFSSHESFSCTSLDSSTVFPTNSWRHLRGKKT